MITRDFLRGVYACLCSLCVKALLFKILSTFPFFYFEQTNFLIFNAWELHKSQFLVSFLSHVLLHTVDRLCPISVKVTERAGAFIAARK